MSHAQVWPHFDANKSIWLFLNFQFIDNINISIWFQIFSLVGDISLWLGIFFYSVNVTHCKLRFQIFCLVGNFLQYFTISKISLTFEIFSLIENIFILQSLVYPRLAHCDLEAVLLRRSYSSINLNFCFNFIPSDCSVIAKFKSTPTLNQLGIQLYFCFS